MYRGYDQQGGNYLPQQSTYQPQHHYYPPQPSNQSTNQSINQLNQSNSRYQPPAHHQHLPQQSINQSLNQSHLNNPFVLPSYIQPHQQHQFAINDIGVPSRNDIDAAQSLLNHSSSSKRVQSHAQPLPQPSKSSKVRAPSPRRSKQVAQSKSPVKASKRKRENKKSRKRKNYSSDSSSADSSSDDSSSDESSSSEDEPEDLYDPRAQQGKAMDKNLYGHPQFPHRMDHKEHSDDDDDGADSDSLHNWTCPPYTEDLTALHESFQALMNHWKPEQKRAFERRRREILKAQLKNNINRPDVTFIALLRRAAKIHASLAPDKYKIERDLIVSLFASELPRQLTMSLFDLSAWTIQRIVTATQDGENVAGFLEKWKSKIRAISTTNPDGSVSVHYSSKTRNRTCKLTGRTMKEEKEIAEKYYTKPENANKDIIAIYAEYLQDMTGGDKTKRAPLSRANFYQLAPDAKKRKAKPEVLRLDCENCHFPIRLRVEEEEIITKVSKKKKVKRLKGAPLDHLLPGAAPGAPAPTIVSTTVIEDKGKKDKDKDSDLYETVEVVELVDGPPKKRIKVEMVRRDGSIAIAAREVPAPASTKSADPKKKRVRTSTAAPSTAMKPEPGPPQLDQHGNPIYSKRGPGRPRKSRADTNLTQQMLSMLPFLPTPVSTLSEQEKQAMGQQVNQTTLDPDRIRGFISQLHETVDLPPQ